MDEITQHIETCCYARALELVERSKNNTVFIGLIKTNSRIINFCSQHENILQLFREKVIIGQSAQPAVFFAGNYEYSEFFRDVLVQAYMHVLGGEKLKNLLFLLNELSVVNTGGEYFELTLPRAELQLGAIASLQKITQDICMPN
jgi:hypothetical protein